MNKRAVLLVAVFALAFVVRVAYIFNNDAHKQPNYLENGTIARNILAGYGFAGSAHLDPPEPEPRTTAFMAPFYPAVLVVSFRLFGEGNALPLLIFQSFLGALTCVFVYLIAERLWSRLSVAAAAGFLCALSYFLVQTAAWTNVTVFTTFLLAAAVLVALGPVREGRLVRDIVLGAILGVGGLVEPVILAVAPVFAVQRAARRTGFGKRLAVFVTIGAVSAAVIMPWTARNYLATGHLVPVKSAFWYNFWRGNNDYASGGDRSSEGKSSAEYLSDEDRRTLGEMGEIERYDRLKARAVAWIRDNPGRFIALRFWSAVYFWTGLNVWYGLRLTYEHPITVPLNVLLFAFAGAGVIIAVRRRTPGIAFLIALLIVYPIPYYICHADIHYRYRVPLDPILILFGSVALVALLGRLFRREPSTQNAKGDE